MRSRRGIVGLLLVLALVIRLVVALTSSAPLESDAADFHRTAVSLAHHGRYPPTPIATPGSPSALRPPGYPAALGATYRVLGDHPTAGRLLGALLGTMTVLLVILLGQRLMGRRGSLIAGLVAALFPPFFFVNASLISEALFLPLELAVALCIVRHSDSRNTRWLVASGALCGTAALTRSVGILLLAPVVVGVLTAPGLSRRARLVGVAAAALATVAVVAPWTARNAVQFHDFVPVSTEAGPTYAGVYNTDAADGSHRALWRPSQLIPQFGRYFHGTLDETELDKRMRTLAVTFAADRPGYVTQVVAYNAARLFDLGPSHSALTKVSYTEMGIPHRFRWPVTISTWLLYAAAFAGLFILRPLRRPPLFLVLIPILLVVPSLFVSGAERYRLVADPFVVLLVAATAVDERKEAGAGRSALSCAGWECGHTASTSYMSE